MKNAIYVYFQYATINKVPLKLKKLGIEPKLIIDGSKEDKNYEEKYGIENISQIVINSYENRGNKRINFSSLINNYLAKSFDIPKTVNENLFSNLPMFVDQFSRYDETLAWRYQDYINYYFTMARFIYNFIKSENIEVIIFSHFCHIGLDLILYTVAKSLNIKTIFFHPEYEIETGKFLSIYTDSLEPDKIYSKMIKKRRKCNFEVPNSFKKNLTYMKNIKKISADSLELKPPVSIKLAINMLVEKNRKEGSGKIFKYLDKINAYYRKRECLISRDSIIKEVDFSKKYVYFGLHLQPEATTSFFGGRYTDQLLAIEQISSIIPDDWIIYVKENPKQTAMNRGRLFYERLLHIPKTVMVPMETNNYELMEHAQFVASITGTMLYEAVCGGKPALMFGNYWYSQLSGVIKYFDGIKTEDILNQTIDHNDLQNTIKDHYSKCLDVIIENNMLKKLVPDQKYNEELNNKNIIEIILELLNE